MRLNQIRDFLAIVESGSLRAAAGKIGISQPAITKSIRQLEEELHVQLLQRNARGAAITRAGKTFLARARVVQAELRKAEDDLAALRGGRERRVDTRIDSDRRGWNGLFHFDHLQVPLAPRLAHHGRT